MGVKKKEAIKKETNPTVDDRLRRFELSCSFCSPHQHENAGRKSRYGKTKPKYKNHRK